MGEVRRATPADADELTRLREVMFAGMGRPVPVGGSWRVDSVAALRKRLPGADATTAAFVVERNEPPAGLAACVIGIIDERLPSPPNPSGLHGYVMSVSTDADQRRRGYSRACLAALLDWFEERGVTMVSLNASPDGEPLYRSVGFGPAHDPYLRMNLATDRTR